MQPPHQPGPLHGGLLYASQINELQIKSPSLGKQLAGIGHRAYLAHAQCVSGIHRLSFHISVIAGLKSETCRVNMTLSASKLSAQATLQHTSIHDHTNLRRQIDGIVLGRVDVEAWGSLAESANQLLGKGVQVAVQGRLKQDKWTDPSGQSRSRLKVAVWLTLHAWQEAS